MIGAAFAVAVLVGAQLPQASVTGTVRDADSGEPLPGARVALTDLDRAALTDAHGAYLLPRVPAGPQHLTITRIGYASRILHALVPRDGAVAIDIFLRTEPIPLRRVDVRAIPPVRGLDGGGESTPGERAVSAAAILHNPLLAEPDALLALAGGVVAVAPESPAGVHIRGGAADQTAYTLDGIPVFSPYHAMGVFAAWNPDAIARVDVASMAASSALPDALSGVVSAVTRASTGRFGARGALTTTQARAAMDGPLGRGGTWLLSLRSGFAGAFPAKSDPTYLRGESDDILAKVEASALGGTVRLLAYNAGNEVDAAARLSSGEMTEPDPVRHAFAWRSGAAGVAWKRAVSGFDVRVEAWRSTARANADWMPDTLPATLSAARRDAGLFVSAEHRGVASETLVGFRMRESRTTYHARTADGGTDLPLEAWTPVASLFASHATTFATAFNAEVGASVAFVRGSGVRVGPRARLGWSSPRVSVEATLARNHQFDQSLRNGESITGAVFPADLFIGAGAPGVPIARATQGVLAADWRPLPGVRIGAEAYTRVLEGLLLVAPVEQGPFLTGRPATGSGTARGIAVDVAANGTHYAAMLAWGWQRVRLTHERGTYTPVYATAQSFDAGVLAHLTSTASLRLSVSGGAGRTATGMEGAFEWEACNLLDRGCEFAGGGRTQAATGGTHPPPYLRIDLGGRKHWHAHLAGRDATVGAFVTVTNVLGRANILTWTTDRSTGERTPLEMRPLAPLVAGLEWRF